MSRTGKLILNFPISLPMSFSFRGWIGDGKSVEISTQRIMFEAIAAVPLVIGQIGSISLEWPMLLDDTTPLKVVFFGTLLADDENGLHCMKIQRHEFRTRRLPAMIADLLPTNLLTI